MRRSWYHRLACLLCFISATAAGQPSDELLDAWSEGDAVVLMRHALAPGIGDPAHFDIEACETQRNLSDAGRDQARRIGDRLRDALGDSRSDVFSSGWCRCLETGRLLGLGAVDHLSSLDSIFVERDREAAATRALVAWLDERLERAAVPAVLVTHQVNITALTDAFASSGAMLVIAPDAAAPNGYGVLGTIETPAAR